MAKTVDYQRSKVYKFEQDTNLLDTSTIPLTTPADALRFITRVLADYNMGPCQLRYVPGRNRGTATGGEYITIGDQYRASRYVLHEVAHIILHRRNPASYRSLNGLENRHGPQFVELLIELRARYCGDSISDLKGAAFKHRIITAPAEDTRMTELLALKAQANAAGDKVTAKLVRRQIRALNAAQLREAAGTDLQARTPVVRRSRQYSVGCRECGKKYQWFPASERCGRCYSTDLDWLD